MAGPVNDQGGWYYTWKSAVSGSWNTPASWAQAAAPHADPNPNQYYGMTGASSDTAVFATRSAQAYAVTGTALATTVDVSDKVTFSNFKLSNGTLATTFETMAGAAVTVGANSSLVLRGTNIMFVGHLNVDAGSTLTDNGSITGSIFSVGGTLNVAGPSAKVYETIPHDEEFGGSLNAGGVINVTRGGYLSTTLLSASGTVDISGSGSTVADLFATKMAATSRVNGANGAVLPGALSDAGLVTAQAGKFTLATGASGTGSILIDSGATLELGGNSSENVAFVNSATLQLDKGVAETGFLQNFSTGDTVDMLGVGLTGYKVTASAGITTVNLFSGASLADTFKLSGSYSLGNFTFRGDGHGGSLMTYVPTPAHTTAPVFHT